MNIPELLKNIQNHYNSLDDKSQFNKAISKVSPVQRIAEYGTVLLNNEPNAILTQNIKEFCINKGLFGYA